MQRKQKKYQKFELLRESKYKMILVRKHERKCQARMPSYEERLWGASVPPLDFLKPGTGGASRAKNVRASSKIFCVAFPGNCTRTCIQIDMAGSNWKIQVQVWAALTCLNRVGQLTLIISSSRDTMDVLTFSSVRSLFLSASVIDESRPACISWGH